MQRRLVIAVAASMLLPACATRATPSDLPVLVGKIVWAAAMHPEDCTPSRCQATFQLEIHNPTDTDAGVVSCDLVRTDGPIDRIPVSDDVPIVVRSGRTQLIRASSLMDLSPRTLRRLHGERIRCADVLDDEP